MCELANKAGSIIGLIMIIRINNDNKNIIINGNNDKIIIIDNSHDSHHIASNGC